MKRSDFFYATGLRAVLYYADSRSMLPFLGIRSASGLQIQSSMKFATDPETENGQRDRQALLPVSDIGVTAGLQAYASIFA